MYIKELNFSLWADFLEREFLDTKFKELIDSGIVNGATSNPTIFKDAITSSNAYKEQLSALKNLSAKEKYEALAIKDIQKAADLLRGLYDNNDDGFVSIEVDPYLCDDTIATIQEALRLYKAIGRENVMIKIPATSSGYEAMRELGELGIPINATLIFKKSQALECAKALSTSRAKLNVISIFISRIDRVLDNIKGLTPHISGIYNGFDIYNDISKMGIKNLKVLFASTGVKGDSLPPHYYIEKLLAPNTINTAPIKTIQAYVKDGIKNITLNIDNDIISAHQRALVSHGVNLDKVLDDLLVDALVQFKNSFRELLESL